MKKLITCLKWTVGLVILLAIIAVGVVLATGLGFLVRWSGLTNLPVVQQTFFLEKAPLADIAINLAIGCFTVLSLFIVGCIVLFLIASANEISQAVFNSKRNKVVAV